jgi:hypothetical protein
VLYLLGGVALLLASVLAGALWDTIGPAGVFVAGALLTGVALAGLLLLRGGYGFQQARRS